jgi:tetratricopeptide (TPR) repeat protein
MESETPKHAPQGENLINRSIKQSSLKKNADQKLDKASTNISLKRKKGIKTCHVINHLFKRDSADFKAVINLEKKSSLKNLSIGHPMEYYEGRFYFKNKKYGKAITSFYLSFEKLKNSKYLYYLSFSYFKSKNYSKALSIIENAIKLNPNKDKFHNLGGQICSFYFKKSKNLKYLKFALKYFEKSDELNPSDSTLFNRYFIKKYLFETKIEQMKSKIENGENVDIDDHHMFPLIFNLKIFNKCIKKYWSTNHLDKSTSDYLRKILNECKDEEKLKNEIKDIPESKLESCTEKPESPRESKKLSIQESLFQIYQNASKKKQEKTVKSIAPIILR